MSTTKWTPGNGSHLRGGVAAFIRVEQRDKDHKIVTTAEMVGVRDKGAWYVAEEKLHLLDKRATVGDYRLITHYRLSAHTHHGSDHASDHGAFANEGPQMDCGLLHGLNNWEPMNTPDVSAVAVALAVAEKRGRDGTGEPQPEPVPVKATVREFVEERKQTLSEAHDSPLTQEANRTHAAVLAAVVEAKPAEPSMFSEPALTAAWEGALKLLTESGEDVPALLRAAADNVEKHGHGNHVFPDVFPADDHDDEERDPVNGQLVSARVGVEAKPAEPPCHCWPLNIKGEVEHSAGCPSAAEPSPFPPAPPVDPRLAHALANPPGPRHGVEKADPLAEGAMWHVNADRGILLEVLGVERGVGSDGEDVVRYRYAATGAAHELSLKHFWATFSPEQGENPSPMKAPEMFAIGSPRWPGVSKITEEAGEVQQVIGKLLGTGGERNHWDGSDLRQRLIEEVGDVLAAADFVAIANDFEAEVRERARQKLALFFKWHGEWLPLPEEEKAKTE